MLDLLGDRNYYYYGDDSHKYLKKLMEGGNRIYIVSPYIDDYYSGVILKNSKNKKFYIVSSSLGKNIRRRLEDRNRTYILSLYLIIFLLSLAILSSFETNLVYLAVFGAIGVLYLVSLFVRYRRNRVELRVPSRFVHAKMYLSDKMGIHGSANLTYKGMHENMEHINITYDKGEIGRLKDEFWRIWNSS
jgi:phosphatidylserine/phosphatidylglycerophosphate/cardiolipin synthase-like enzyme